MNEDHLTDKASTQLLLSLLHEVIYLLTVRELMAIDKDATEEQRQELDSQIEQAKARYAFIAVQHYSNTTDDASAFTRYFEEEDDD